MARYSLFMLKVLLNPKQTNKQMSVVAERCLLGQWKWDRSG